MYQYFLKVVSTQFRTLDGQVVSISAPFQFSGTHPTPSDLSRTRLLQYKTNQYSVTHFERDLSEGGQGDTPQGVLMQHGMYGTPGTLRFLELDILHRFRLLLST